LFVVICLAVIDEDDYETNDELLVN